MDELNDKYSAKPESQGIIMTITLDHSTNKVSVTGPISDKILAYGMLEYARDAIAEHHLKAMLGERISTITKPNGHGILNFVRRK